MGIEIKLTNELIDAVADRVIEKTAAIKEKEAPKGDELEFYTVKQIVQITQKSNLTIRNHINAGLLKAEKIGKSFLVSKEDLKTYLKQK